jgi:translation initiation factor IF-3
MDYSKHRFEQQKKEKETRKKQKTVDVKELRLSPSIDTHDIGVKVKKAIEFLKDGDKVKVTIRFRGRELGRTEIAHTIFADFTQKVSEYGNVEKPPKMEARSMAMFLAPKPEKKEKPTE